ncbi:FtsW/RodA/SpoVE family cell cycle protein, partial [Patescibacteria group bacterium]|nr:FtsW/RodA/SpoVE family cell cycle protein [Patescibacteria group bacterium]
MNKRFLLPIFLSLLILFSFNILMVNSLAPQLVGKQTLSWGIGIFLFFVGKQINIKQIARYKQIILFTSCVLLLIPILQKNTTRGTLRWIHIGNIQIQPSEIVRPWLTIVLVNTQQYLYIIIPALLVFFQPDLGGAISTLSILIPFLLYDQRLRKTLFIILGILTISSPFIWKFALRDYQKDRII